MDDTVVAISSAPGAGAVGILRLSGPRALEIADRIARPKDARSLAEHRSWTRVPGEVVPSPAVRAPAFFHLYRAPRSYTRQHVVEVYTVGSPILLDAIRNACINHGALAAQAGEFTARAFFNGMMDLSQAEAVAAIIRAQSDAQLRASRRMMDGSLTRRIGVIRDELAELLALVEADIDFAEEPIDFIRPDEFRDRVRRAAGQLDELLTSAPSVERLSRLPNVLLLGPTNAGKSSLMNRLSGASRAICAAVAGTTRDILSAPAAIGSSEVLLLDAAGVDDSQDEIIAQARSLALQAAERVEAVCIVIDAGVLLDNSTPDPVRSFLNEIRGLDLPPALAVLNKADLLPPARRTAIIEHAARWAIGPVILVSAATGEGVGDLRLALSVLLGGQQTTAGAEAAFMSERQRLAAAEAASALSRAAALADGAQETIDCADLLAFELREALDALGEVTGAVTTEDLLTHVFANFCIGK